MCVDVCLRPYFYFFYSYTHAHTLTHAACLWYYYHYNILLFVFYTNVFIRAFGEYWTDREREKTFSQQVFLDMCA